MDRIVKIDGFKDKVIRCERCQNEIHVKVIDKVAMRVRVVCDKCGKQFEVLIEPK